MTGQQRVPADLQALHGTTTEVEQVTVTEDLDGIPAFIKVDRELAGVVIVPSLLQPPAARQQTAPGTGLPSTPATACQVRRADQTDSPDETLPSPARLHHEGVSQ